MRLHHLSSDADRIRSQSMKNLSRVVLGSVAGSLLGAASFFAIDGLITRTSKAQSVDMSVHVMDSTTGADEWWYVTDSPTGADMEICLSGDNDHWFETINN